MYEGFTACRRDAGDSCVLTALDDDNNELILAALNDDNN